MTNKGKRECHSRFVWGRREEVRAEAVPSSPIGKRGGREGNTLSPKRKDVCAFKEKILVRESTPRGYAANGKGGGDYRSKGGGRRISAEKRGPPRTSKEDRIFRERGAAVRRKGPDSKKRPVI